MTFLSLDQPRVFLLSVAFGAYFGVCYFPFYFLSLFFKQKWLKHVVTATWLVFGALPFSKYAQVMNFPNFSPYMVAGVLLGLGLYVASFHKLVAILAARVYNVVNNLIKRLYKALKGKNERRKKKTSVLGSSFGANNVFYGANVSSCISNDRHFRKKKQNRQVRCRD